MAPATGTGGICPRSKRSYTPSPKRDAAKERLRKWKRHRKRWATQPRFHGGRLVELAEACRARPFELGDLRHALTSRDVMTLRALLALEWLLAATFGFGGNAGGLKISHKQTAKLLHCCPTEAQHAMHELVKLGLVEQRPGFRERTLEEREPKSRQEVLDGSPRHYEVASTWAVTPRGLELASWSRRFNEVGKKHQPGRNQRPLRGHRIGVRGRGRHARSFVDAVLFSRKPPAAPVEVARLRMPLPDGGVALGPALNAATLAQKLGTEGARGRPPNTLDAAIASAWAAFEAKGDPR